MVSAESISVSDILRASVCPMQLYLAKSSPADFVEPLRYSVAKQISYHLGEPLDAEEIACELTTVIPDCGEDGLSLLKEMIAACRKSAWRHADAYDVSVYSESYQIHGRVDRMFDDSFSIVKGGSAPTHGIYQTDRLQAACYALCLEEMYGKEFYPMIEYLGSGTVRSVSLTPSDRRLFLTALKEVEKIRRGVVPRAVRGEKCTHCRFVPGCKPLEKPKSLFDKLKR